MTYRYGPHTMAGDDPTRYRTSDEDADWEKRPISSFQKIPKTKDYGTKKKKMKLLNVLKTTSRKLSKRLIILQNKQLLT